MALVVIFLLLLFSVQRRDPSVRALHRRADRAGRFPRLAR
jgi:hypothetical protein